MMQNLISHEPAVLLLGMTMCLFMALYFFVDSKDSKSPRRFLAGFMFVYGLTFADNFLDTSGISLQYPHVTGLLVPSFFLLGPLIYFYIRDMCDSRAYILDKSRYRHFILPVISILLMSAFYMFPEQFKRTLLTGENIIPETGFFLLGILGIMLVQIILPLQILYYLIRSYQILLQYFTRLKDFFANIEDQRLDWLRILLLMMSVQWIIYAYDDLIGWPEHWHDVIDFYTTLVDVGIIYFLSFKGLRHVAISGQEMTDRLSGEPKDRPVGSGNGARQKYAKSALSADDIKRILSKLQHALEGDELFNDSMLSLRSLSDHTRISTNNISQAINQSLECNFFDFINGFRIKEAMKQLRKSGEDKIPVLEIAHAVGFNSKSTFNAAFKRHCGLTPTEYRRQQASPD
ncbi:hypothetical protein MNBD_ALPHA01-658 [hydrothermal vent metagenome]|uniref:HTH araC/xylS-type domain-containing protein n=1 Tax=hydrothermal vent metagenome TaxID=652676 RepID=A0A3B0SIX1_9ZZZZ